MPYANYQDPKLPDSVRKLPKRLAELFVSVFNDAFEETDGDEGAAMKAAWGAVRKTAAAKERKPVHEQEAVEPTAEKSVELYDHIQAVAQAFTDTIASDTDVAVAGVYDDHIVVQSANGYFKVFYMAELATAADGETQIVAAVTFAEPVDWIPVVRTYTAVKTINQPDGRVRWLGVSSGGYEDREGQIVSSDLLQQAVKEADATGNRGGLWVYHTPGTEVGSCDYQTFTDGFLLESGLMHQTPAGEAATRYLQTHDDVGMSIQFAYKQLTPDGVYMPPGYIIERSILPASAAAFPWSGIVLTELINMTTIPDEKRQALAEILGEEQAEAVLSNLEANAKALTGAGVRYKELGGGDEQALPAETSEPEAAMEPPTESEAETEQMESKEIAVVEPEMEAPAPASLPETEPAEYEFELSDAALDQLAERVLARLDLGVTVEKAYDPVRQQVGELRALVDALSADVARLSESEEARIVEKAANMPRATMRRILRPTQRKELEEPEQPTPSDAKLIDIGKKTLYT